MGSYTNAIDESYRNLQNNINKFLDEISFDVEGGYYTGDSSAWGQGNATTATKWLLDYMKRKYKNATLFADVVVDNVASEKVLQKLGFEQFSEELIERDGKQLKVHNYKL